MLTANTVPTTQVLASLPIFPLPNVVLLPGMVLPLNVFEPRYLELVDFVRANGQHIGVPLLRPPDPLHTGPLPIESVFGVGRLVFHVPLPDGRRIIRLEGVCRVRARLEHPAAHAFRELDVVPLAEPRPLDTQAVAILRAQIERISRYCGEDGESLSSLLTIPDIRVFLYALTAFLPSLELMVAREGELTGDRHALIDLQQQSLAAETADERVRFLAERTAVELSRLAEIFTTPPGVLH
jgi:Lon protease-like protein